MRFRQAVATTFGRQIVALGVGVVTASLMSRALGAEQYGKYALANLSVQFAHVIFSVSIPATIVYYAERYRQSGSLSRLFGAAITLQAITTTALIVFAFLAWRLNAGNIQSVAVDHLMLLGVLFLGTVANTTLESFLLGLRCYGWFNGLLLVKPLLLLSGVMYFLNSKSNWNDAVFVQVIATVIMLPGYLLAVRRVGLPWPEVSLKPSRQLFAYGRYLWAANVLGVANYRVQYLIIEFLVGSRLLGQYALGNQFAEKLWIPGQAIATIIFPERAAALQKSSRSVVQQGLKIAGANMAFVLVGTMTIYFFVLLFGVRVFGAEFSDLPAIVMGLALGITAWAGTKILAAELAGQGRSLDNAWIAITSLIMGALGIWLGSKSGAFGIALGVSAGYITGFLVALMLFLQVARNTQHER